MGESDRNAGNFVAVEGPDTEAYGTGGSPDGHAAVGQLLLTRRMRDFTTGATLSLLPALGSIVALVYTFRDQVDLAVLIGWATVQLVLIAVYVVFDSILDRESPSLGELRRHWRRFVLLHG